MNRVFIMVTLVTLLSPLLYGFSVQTRVPFDDVADMLAEDRNSALILEEFQNELSSHILDSTRNLNINLMREARRIFNDIYGELSRKPNPPVLAKYKLRLLREFYQATYYKQTTKLQTSQHISCNYMNNIQDDNDPSSFHCVETKHKCVHRMIEHCALMHGY